MFIVVTTIRPSILVAGPGCAAASAAPGADVLTSTARGLSVSEKLADALLPSWRTGSVRDALIGFLDAVEEVPTVDRVAFFDNDGTLWCERPSYGQLDFFLDALRRHVAKDSSSGEREEFAPLLSGDRAAIAAIGLERIAVALAGLFDGLTPQEFTAQVRVFMAGATHNSLGRPLRSGTYSRCWNFSTNFDAATSPSASSPVVVPSSSERSAMTCTGCRPSGSWAPSSATSSAATGRIDRSCVARPPCSAPPTRGPPK